MKELCVHSWYQEEGIAYARINIDDTEVKIQGNPDDVKSIIKLLEKNTTEVIYA